MNTDNTVSRDLTNYRHVESYRVRYDDLDTYRHVNNKAYLTWIEDARVYYLIEGAGFSHHQDERRGVMVVHFSIDYLSQVHSDQSVKVYTRAARIGVKSVTLHHVITVEETSKIAATATTVFASVDLKTNRSCQNDPEMVKRVLAYEAVPPLDTRRPE